MLLLAALVAMHTLPPIPKPSEIRSIVIRHDPDDIIRYASWPLSVLHDARIPGTRITRQMAIRQIIGAIRESGMRIVPGKPRMTDATTYSPKWSFVFTKTDDTIDEISVDATGTTGALDKTPVTFSALRPELKRLTFEMPWLEGQKRERLRSTPNPKRRPQSRISSRAADGRIS